MPASGTLKWKIMSLTHHPDGRTEYTPGSEPGSPWEHGSPESFSGKLRDELLNVEIFDTLREAQVLTERWRREKRQTTG